MYKCQCGIYFIIYYKIRRIDPRVCDRIFQQCAELILSDLSEKRRLLSHFVEKS